MTRDPRSTQHATLLVFGWPIVYVLALASIAFPPLLLVWVPLAFVLWRGHKRIARPTEDEVTAERLKRARRITRDFR